jgi:hypothetical protein
MPGRDITLTHSDVPIHVAPDKNTEVALPAPTVLPRRPLGTLAALAPDTPVSSLKLNSAAFMKVGPRSEAFEKEPGPREGAAGAHRKS